MIVLGIDPGRNGGLALVERRGAEYRVIDARMMPLREHKEKHIFDPVGFHIFLDQNPPVHFAVLEEVAAMPGQGVSSMFSFGRVYGAVEATTFSRCAEPEYVRPAVWKKAMGLSKDKNESLHMATLYFGSKYWPLKKHEGVAEAALLALYWLQHRAKE